MPIHDWTRVDDGAFYDFHLGWIMAIRTALNTGVLPDDFYALAEPAGDIAPRMLPLGRPRELFAGDGNLRHLVIRNLSSGQIVAVVEVVSPSEDPNQQRWRLVQRAIDLLRQGTHLLVVDMLPRTPGNDQGIHGAIWRRMCDDESDLPIDAPLTLIAYAANEPLKAYVEPVRFRERLLEMPLFLTEGKYVPVPLERTCMEAWQGVPKHLRQTLEQ